MRKILQAIALSFAMLAAANTVASDDFRVVVPLYGKKAVDAGIALTQAPLPAGTVSEAYAGFDFKTVLQVTSDKPVDMAGVTWAAASALPAGLSLSSTGVLTGVPTAAAVDSPPFTVTATYASKSAAQNYTVTVAPGQVDEPDVPPSGPVTGGQDQVSDGEATLTVVPTKISYGLVARQLPTTPIMVAISNTGTKTGTVRVDQPANPEYKLTHNCPGQLAVGAACQAAVVFTPSTSLLLKSSFNIWLGTQGLSVALDGTGRNSAVTFTHLPKNNGGQDFGIVAAGQFVARQTIIKNTSKYYALGIFDVGMNPSSPYANQFRVENSECPPILQVGESCTITPIFAPTAKGTYSAYSKLKMNVAGDYSSFYVYGRAAGDLAVTRLSQQGASLPGGQEIYVQGDGILPGAKVSFGETEASTRYGSTSYIYATVPPVDAPEDTYIRVENPDGAAATAPTPFKRARSFAAFSIPGPLQYGKQALNVPSQWQSFSLRNNSYSYKDTLTISDIHTEGPYQVDTSSGYCAPGRVLNGGGYSCPIRVRFVPTAEGAAPGQLTVVGNGETLTLQLTGTGLAWDGTPSGSATDNTDLPYNTVVSGNEPVGGATQTKFVDVYFRNTNPAAQLNAYFSLADGTAFKMYSINKVSVKGATVGAGCLSSSTPKDSLLCRADVGSGTYPHLQVRLQATSAAGVGTHYEELIVRDAAGEEQFRIPLWLDVVYDVWVQPFADYKLTVPKDSVTAEHVQLAQEAYQDVYLANVGTHGMLKTDGVTLVDKSSADIYLKSDSLYRSTTLSTGMSTCGGKLVSADEVSGCLSDDVDGGTYKNQRVRVYFKPMSSGLRTATLRIAHRGQGDNPLNLQVSISPIEFNAAFSGSPSSSGLTAVTVPRLSANYEVDKTNSFVQFNVYLNSTDGQLMKGYFVLSGDSTGRVAEYPTPFTWTPGTTSATGSTLSGCGMQSGSRLQSALCATSTTYPGYRVMFTIYSILGAGTYNWQLTYYDPAGTEIMHVPLVVEILNDNQPEASLTHNARDPLPGGVWDFGTLTAPTAPSQLIPSVTKNLYLRNLGTYGKMKFDGAYIDGGDGAFTFAQPLYVLGDTQPATNNSGCGSSKTDAYNVSKCIAYDPQTYPGAYNHVKVQVTYKPLAPGNPKGNLVIWHHSPAVENPLVIPLTAVAAGEPVAGEMSGSYSATVPVNGDFGLFAKSGGAKDMQFYVRNPGPYGALYTEQTWIEGPSYFTLTSAPYRISDTNSYTTCGSTRATDGRSATACLSDTYDSTGIWTHQRYTVRCTLPSTAPAGTYTGTLRVKTQGAEHAFPLSCSKS